MNEQPPAPSGPWAPPVARTALPLSADAAAPLAADTGAAAAPPDRTAARRRQHLVKVVIGMAIAVGSGAFLLLAVDSWMPRRAESGVVTRTDIETRRVRRNGRTTTETDHIVLGTTDSGETWRIVSEDAYDIVDRGSEVDLEFSRLSGRVVSIDSTIGHYDERSVPLSIVAGAAPVVAAIAYLATWRRARRRQPWPRWLHLLAVGCVAVGMVVGSSFD